MSGDFFQSGPYRLYYRYYPVENARAVCVTLHGHGEHAGRYEKFQKVMEEEKNSYAVFDYRGQGRSEGRDVCVDSLNDYVDDMSAFLAFLEEHFGVREKIILHGNSLGALVAVHWALKNKEKLRGMVLSSPCLGLGLPASLIMLNNFLNMLCPFMIYRNPVYPPHLTHSSEEMELYRKDPLIKRRISVRLVHEMISRGRAIGEIPRFEFPFPVYMLLAGLEKVVDGKRAEEFFEKLQVPDKKFRLFPDFYHELFHEKDQDQAYGQLREYLRLICNSPRPAL